MLIHLTSDARWIKRFLARSSIILSMPIYAVCDFALRQFDVPNTRFEIVFSDPADFHLGPIHCTYSVWAEVAMPHCAHGEMSRVTPATKKETRLTSDGANADRLTLHC